jgi:hypothetical protein
LDYGTFLGGSGHDNSWGIAVDTRGQAYVTGNTQAANFPHTSAAMDRALSGNEDGFVSKLQVTLLYSIRGSVRTSTGSGIGGVTISAGAGRTATTAADGSYTLNDLPNGAYTLTPSKPGHTFTPPSHTISVPPSATSRDFTVAVQAAADDRIFLTMLIRARAACNDVEPNNDTNAGAQPIASSGTECDGSMENERVGGDDWYVITLAQGKRLTIDLSGIPAGANYDLYLYRDPPSLQNQVGRSAQAGNVNERIDYTADRAGSYKLRIFKRADAPTLDSYVLRVVVN